ncbi:MAG: family 43 glycosylhydrolase [Cyclobacteriaceae bacterium]
MIRHTFASHHSLLTLSLLVFTLFQSLGQQVIKFEPVTSKTTSLLPKPEGLVYQGNYTSITEVFEDNGKYYMIVNDLVGGWPAKKINVALLESADLEHWSWLTKPLFSSEDLPYKLSKPRGFATSIIKHANGTYFLYMDVLDNDQNLGIGLATAPALTGPWKVHPSLVLKPDENTWDAHALVGGDVIEQNGKFIMYYMGMMTAIKNGETAIGVAESADGIKWEKREKPVITKSAAGFDKCKIGVPKIIHDGEGYTLIYRSDNCDGSWGGDSAYGIAKSEDGISWQKQSTPVLHEDDVENWRTIWACGLIRVEDTYHLFLEYDGPPSYDTRVNHAIYKLR